MVQNHPAAAEPESARTYVTTRVFAVPARILFQAHSAPEHVRRWFGPKAWPLSMCEMDFRVGGQYRFAMTSLEGEKGHAFGGEYLEIVPNQKISFSNTLELPGAETMIVTVTFEEHDGTTTLTHKTVFASVAMKNLHLGYGYEGGLGSSLDCLEEVVLDLSSTRSS